MKKLLFLSLSAALLSLTMFALVGCVTKAGYQDPTTGDVYSVEEYPSLSAEVKARVVEVEYSELKPTVLKTGDAIAGTATAGYEIVKPFIPEPFATGGALLIGLIVAGWQLLRKRQVVSTLARVKLGADITARTVDAVVKGTELWEKFKEEQTKSSSNTDAIMPDKVNDAA